MKNKNTPFLHRLTTEKDNYNKQRTMNLIERLDVLHHYGIDVDTSTIFFAGEIDGNLPTVLRIKVAQLKAYHREHFPEEALTEINLLMNSVGGDASAITSVLDYFEYLRDKENILVNTHAEGQCMSAATFIVGSGTGKRTAGKRTRFMVHEIQIEGIGGTATQTKSSNAEIERMQQECYDLYASFTFSKRKTKPSKKEYDTVRKEWVRLCEKETYFAAEEAVKQGLIDEVI
jgi:ATP-dependent protease ClpP protease subunit